MQRHRSIQGVTLKLAVTLAFSLAFCNVFATSSAYAQSGGNLKMYFVDVEGGQATLFVTPSGQSLLIDTGWPGNNGRDADRIVAAAKNAGLSHIDYVLITHYHDDHVGGVAQLVARIPVGEFIDHGPNRETNNQGTERGWENYQKVVTDGHYKHSTVKPGDILPITGIRAIVISSDGDVITSPVEGAGAQNPYCLTKEMPKADQTENSRSLGILIYFGKLKILDLGDLTVDKERSLMCPVNRLGHIDVLVVSHHGWYQSSSPVLVDAIAPSVAIMDNGAIKGGSTPVLETLSKSPGLLALWQLHFSEEGGASHNSPAEFIANLHGDDQGNYLKLTASEDGRFKVFNSRTDSDKSYAARH